MKHQIIICLFLAFLSTSCKKTDSAYSLKINAPFKMDNITLFKYPDRNFNLNNYINMEESVENPEEQDFTEAINMAINECYIAGGGTVIIPPGIWHTGPIHMKSNVNLHLMENAVLRFWGDPKKYLPAVLSSHEGIEVFNYSPLIYAYDCKNIAITGRGLISPDMEIWEKWFKRGENYMNAISELHSAYSLSEDLNLRHMEDENNKIRPSMIHFNRCSNIILDGFKIRESPFWCIHLFLCDNAVIRNLDIKAHGHNNDGVDIEMTSNVIIENCTFDQGDDAIVLKAARNQDGWRLNKCTENIVIRNCTIKKGHTMLGIGSELSAGIKNVYMHDCIATNYINRCVFIKTNNRRGGFVKNIYVNNITSKHSKRIFEIDTDVMYQWRNLPTYETRLTEIEGIYIENFKCDSTEMIFKIKGDSILPVNNILLKDIYVQKVIDRQSDISNANNILVENVSFE